MLDKKVFAERLKAKRHEKQLNQAQLAKILHVAPSAISNYERGVVFPEIRLAEKMSRYFGVSLDWLIGVTDEESDGYETPVFLKAINDLLKVSDLHEEEADIIIRIPKETLIADFMKDQIFVNAHTDILSENLKQYIKSGNKKLYEKYSVEELLKEKTAKRGNA